MRSGRLLMKTLRLTPIMPFEQAAERRARVSAPPDGCIPAMDAHLATLTQGDADVALVVPDLKNQQVGDRAMLYAADSD